MVTDDSHSLGTLQGATKGDSEGTSTLVTDTSLSEMSRKLSFTGQTWWGGPGIGVYRNNSPFTSPGVPGDKIIVATTLRQHTPGLDLLLERIKPDINIRCAHPCSDYIALSTADLHLPYPANIWRIYMYCMCCTIEQLWLRYTDPGSAFVWAVYRYFHPKISDSYCT